MKKKKTIFNLFYNEITIHDVDVLSNIFAHKRDLIILSSRTKMKDHSQYSFICFDSFASFRTKNLQSYWNNHLVNVGNPFDFINKKIKQYQVAKNKTLPPLQGGVVGYFGYEAGHYLESLPIVIDNIQLPDIYVNFYHSIIAIDHLSNQSWIISTGFPEKKCRLRKKIAKKNIFEIKRRIEKSVADTVENYSSKKLTDTITSNFTKNTYMKAVLDTKKYIINGDIFEANISQQFSSTIVDGVSELEIYFKLMKVNPAPYSSFVKMPNNSCIISASPERFIKIENQAIETYPIKGTRKRSKNAKEDSRLAEELLSSEKDHAENVMIVDLMRNDLSRVCQLGSIKVDELCALKSFETVHHLVSKITGQLKKEMTATDVIKASFPPGSVTGAPKIRAMEVISELEMQARGPYCGCIGYLSFTGDMDTSVTIRSYFINNRKIFFSTGGAITLDSNAEEEFFESLTKANALIRALNT